MMAAKFTLSGVTEMRQRLERIGDEVATDGVRKALFAAAEPIRDSAEDKAPEKSGFLKDNIIIVEVDTSRHGAAVDVGPHEDAFYGLFQELGTEDHAAQPFLRPAFDESAVEARQRAAVVLRMVIEGVL